MRKFKMVKCPSCGRTFRKVNSWCTHMITKHPDDIPEGFTPMQYLYGVITGRYEGKCMYCGGPTDWNEATGKYGKLCGKASCRDKYADQHQLLSPEKQREMLSKRKISSIYRYDNVDILYTGTYELRFLEFMHKVLDWPASDILSPSPNTYYYDYVNPEDPYHEGKKFYIPDFYIPSLNLEIEIKDQTTTHPKFLKIDKVKEACKDKRMEQLKSSVNYIKINDNNFDNFMKCLEDLKLTFSNKELTNTKVKAAVESFGPNYMASDGYMVATATEAATNLVIDQIAREITLEYEVERWSNDTGLVMIHYCNDLEELDELYEEFKSMDENDKAQSDTQSIHYFNMDNDAHYEMLRTFFRENIVKLPYLESSDSTEDGSSSMGATESAIANYVMDKIETLVDSISKYKCNGCNNIEKYDDIKSYLESMTDKVYMCKVEVKILADNIENPNTMVHPFFIFSLPGVDIPLYYEASLDEKYNGIYAANTIADIFQSVHMNICKLLNNNELSYSDSFDIDDIYSSDTNKIINLPITMGNIFKVNNFEDLMHFINYLAENPEESVPVIGTATEGAVNPLTVSMAYNIAQTWYQKMFVGGISLDPIKIATSLKNKLSIVTIEDGDIVIKNLSTRSLFNRMQNFYNTKHIKNVFIIEYNKKSLANYKKKKIPRNRIKVDNIHAPLFFALELIEIFTDLGKRYRDKNYIRIAEDIYKKTWVSVADNNLSVTSELDLSRLSNLTLELLPYQKEFIKNYDRLKAHSNLKGYVLAFDQGLGKTLTAVSLAECGKYDHVYVVCPNSLIDNWRYEIKSYYSKYSQNEALWNAEVVNCKKGMNGKSGKFFITNQESIMSLKDYVKPGKNILIVDESHNFRNINGKRVNELLTIQKLINPADTLLMSGTPIKAMPSEIAPALRLIDPLFTDKAAEMYVKAFNIDNTSASNMINKRFGMIIYRKDKSELDLPDKTFEELFYSVSGSKRYTLSSIRNEFGKLFSEIYTKKLEENESLLRDMQVMIRAYSKAPVSENNLYIKWLRTVNTSKTMRVHDSEQDIIDGFLDTYVYPYVSDAVKLKIKDLEKKFLHMKNSAISTALGAIIPPARRDLFIQLFDENKDDIIQKIDDNDKKTVIFSQFKPVVDHIGKVLNEMGIETVVVTGDIVADRMEKINEFKEVDTVRVLVATSSTVGTGFTLTEADQVFFFGVPWRDADFNQCCDRVHRIGQTTEVNIYSVLLETPGEPNLSTRMDNILKWSKEMFNSAISVTDTDTEDPIEELQDKLEAMESNITMTEENLIAME